MIELDRLKFSLDTQVHSWSQHDINDGIIQEIMSQSVWLSLWFNSPLVLKKETEIGPFLAIVARKHTVTA